MNKELIEEAKRRFSYGTRFIDLVHNREFIVSNAKFDNFGNPNQLYVQVKKSKGIVNKTARIWKDGEWAQVVHHGEEQITRDQVRSILGSVLRSETREHIRNFLKSKDATNLSSLDAQYLPKFKEFLESLVVDKEATKINWNTEFKGCNSPIADLSACHTPMPKFESMPEILSHPREVRFIVEFPLDMYQKREVDIEDGNFKQGDYVVSKIGYPFLNTEEGNMHVTEVCNLDEVWISGGWIPKKHLRLANLWEIEMFNRGFRNINGFTMTEMRVEDDDGYYHSERHGPITIRHNRKVIVEVLAHPGRQRLSGLYHLTDSLKSLHEAIRGNWKVGKYKKPKLKIKEGLKIAKGSDMVESSKQLKVRTKNRKL